MKDDFSVSNILNKVLHDQGFIDTVYIIGTPNSIQLGQSVSGGVLSDVRKFNELVYLQTDAKINSGNSGDSLLGENVVDVTSKHSSVL